MKKHIQFIIILMLPLFISSQAISQTNYYGVSGNMVSGDFDNDGLLDDIAAFNTSGELPVLNLWNSNNGWIDESQATCRLPFDFLSSKSLNSKIVAGDFDNDGFIDDIASIYEIGLNQTSVTVWINNKGEYTPQRWWYGGDFDANQVEQTIVAGDFDNDGFVDDIAAFYNYDQKTTKVYVWNSDGTKFAWPGTWWIGNDFNATRIQGTMVAGDFDHDGYQDDIAALYNYSDGFCKIFVWTKNKNKFNWPYTWYAQADFSAENLKNNVVAGDFNKNGFVDNIAALYNSNESASSIIVFERNNTGFGAPSTWWYGTNEATSTNMRLVSADINSNFKADQISGLSIVGNEATLATWTAEDNIFIVPESSWQGVALALEDCEKEGGCLPNNLAGELNLYPNPSNGNFTIEIPTSSDFEVEISVFNVLGSQLMNFKAQSGINLPIQMDNFKTGTYVIEVTGNDFTIKKNFILQ